MGRYDGTSSPGWILDTTATVLISQPDRASWALYLLIWLGGDFEMKLLQKTLSIKFILLWDFFPPKR